MNLICWFTAQETFLSMLKTVVLHNIFSGNFVLFRIHRWIKSSKEQYLFEIGCNVINVLTVTFDQYELQYATYI